ncbi:MAG TPA: TonB-dependent receptor plug domain-containing protein, partial [Gemmatimonadales bacterium]|nr:TonB-dependent receptor plug domain-containing protein [Gemmatimonadales bacterium]
MCASQFEGIPARYLEELLEGRVAGVWLVRLPDGGVSLRIGGPTSIHGDNEPLYVLDGMPLQTVPGRGIEWLSPRDIERIEILKDPSATALYG